MDKPILFVRGNINCSGYISFRNSGTTCRGHVKEEDYDLSSSIVVDGDIDIDVKNILINGGLVVATGNICIRVKRKEG